MSDDDFNPYLDDEPTTQIRTERLAPAQHEPVQPQPAGDRELDRRWLLALGALALVLLVVAVALGASRQGWKDRAVDAEAELSDARTALAEAEQAAADAAEEAAALEPQTDSTDPAPGDEESTDPAAAEDTDAAADETEDVVLDCEDFGVDGGDIDGAGYYSISTRNLDCDEAKQLILGRGFDAEANPDADEYTCTTLERVDETATFRCENGDQAFRYSAGA